MTAIANLLSALGPWLLAVTLLCSLFILALRTVAEPFAPGIEFGPLVRRLIDRGLLERIKVGTRVRITKMALIDFVSRGGSERL